MCELDVAGLNLIDRSATNDNPDYNILEEFRHHEITIWMNHEGYLLIVATLDKKYSYWTSVTKVDECEKNAAILDYISRVDEANPKKFVQYYWMRNPGHLLEETNCFEHLRDDKGRIDLSKWYECSFILHVDDDLIEVPSREYVLTKEDHRFEKLGVSMAGAVIGFFGALQDKCVFREASGAYGRVLDNYRKMMEQKENDPMYYEEIGPLTKIIKDESYMLLSPNDKLREKYVALVELEYHRYCRYMSAVR